MPRVRKVKCDEAKPYCLRCTRSGRRCDGYLDTAAGRCRRRRSGAPAHALTAPGLITTAASTASAAARGCAVPRVPGLVVWASSDEKRSFDFFRHITAPSLAGDLDAVFWRVLVLQLCHTEPAVRHAALAVSSLHEDFLRPALTTAAPASCRRTRQAFALQQYNKAIACLLEGLHPGAEDDSQRGSPSRRTRASLARPVGPLMTCLLFVCIEVMLGKGREALLHLEKGRHILGQLSRNESLDISADPDMAVVMHHLAPLYARLGMTLFLFGANPVPLPAALQSHLPPPPNTLDFTSIHALRAALYGLMDSVLRFTQEARCIKYPSAPAPSPSSPASPGTDDEPQTNALEETQHRLGVQLARLRVAHSLFHVNQSATGTSSALSTTMALLQIHLHISHVWLATALSRSEMVFDDHLAAFASVVSLAASVLDAERHHRVFAGSSSAALRQDRPSPAVFTLETHVIPALYFVATKCRHAMVRRAALGLLTRNRGRRENLWRADTLSAIAARLIAIEETPAAAVKKEESREPTAEGSSRLLSYEQQLCPNPNPLEQYLLDPLFGGVNDLCASWESPHAVWSARSPGHGYYSQLFEEDGTAEDVDDVGSGTDTCEHIPCSKHPTQNHDGDTNGTHDECAVENSQAGTEPTDLHLDSQALCDSEEAGEGPPTPAPPLTMLPLPGDGPYRAEPPLHLPEHARIHTAVIGAEADGGSWITVFRKPQGLDGPWDVQTEFVHV